MWALDTDLRVHRSAFSIRYSECCSVDRQPDGPSDRLSEGVVHADWELDETETGRLSWRQTIDQGWINSVSTSNQTSSCLFSKWRIEKKFCPHYRNNTEFALILSVCVFSHLSAGLCERTHADVEAVTVRSFSRGAAERSQTVTDQNLTDGSKEGQEEVIRQSTIEGKMTLINL